MLIILSLTGFLAVVLFAYLAFSVRERNRDEARVLKARLQEFEEIQRTHREEELSLVRDDVISKIPLFNQILAKLPSIKNLQQLLDQAGLKLRPGVFLLLCGFSGTLMAALVSWLSEDLFMSMIGFGAGVLLPMLYLKRMRKKRFKAFEEKFPNAIEFLARAIRAGHPFSACLEMLGSEMPEPVAGEFMKIYDQQKYGLPMRDALLGLTERVPLIDVRFFVTSVLLQRETGGNLGEILDKLSYVIRERFKILRQVQVFTAQGRMSMFFLILLPPGVGILTCLVNREFVQPLFSDPIGRILLIFAIVSQVVGFLVIRRIVQIKV
jgi:tight adherence protein B